MDAQEFIAEYGPPPISWLWNDTDGLTTMSERDRVKLAIYGFGFLALATYLLIRASKNVK